MLTSSKGNIFRVTGLLCREFTGHRWIPRTKPVTRSFHVSLICAWTDSWANNGDAGDLRRHSVHYNVFVINNFAGFTVKSHRLMCWKWKLNIKHPTISPWNTIHNVNRVWTITVNVPSSTLKQITNSTNRHFAWSQINLFCRKFWYSTLYEI